MIRDNVTSTDFLFRYLWRTLNPNNRRGFLILFEHPDLWPAHSGQITERTFTCFVLIRGRRSRLWPLAPSGHGWVLGPPKRGALDSSFFPGALVCPRSLVTWVQFKSRRTVLRKPGSGRIPGHPFFGQGVGWGPWGGDFHLVFTTFWYLLLRFFFLSFFVSFGEKRGHWFLGVQLDLMKFVVLYFQLQNSGDTNMEFDYTTMLSLRSSL